MIIEGVEEDAFLASRRASSCPLKGMFLDVERPLLAPCGACIVSVRGEKSCIKSEESVLFLALPRMKRER